MGNYTEAISAILSKLAQFLGIKMSNKRQTELIKHKLADAKASNIDRLEVLKASIKQHETQALRKKKEYEETKGSTKRIIKGEIERIFRSMDLLQGQEKVIISNIERISLAQSKLDEIESAEAKGAEESELDDIALDLQEAYEGLMVADRASRDLKDIDYQAPEQVDVDAEKRMAEVEGEQEAKANELNPEIAQRLKQLETDEE